MIKAYKYSILFLSSVHSQFAWSCHCLSRMTLIQLIILLGLRTALGVGFHIPSNPPLTISCGNGSEIFWHAAFDKPNSSSPQTWWGMSPSGLVSMAVMHDRLIGCGLSGIEYSGAPGWKAKSCTQLNCRQIKFSWAGRDFSKLNFSTVS